MEVYPKFVLGKEKYGRRTRPKGAQLAAAKKNNEPDSEPPAGGAADLKSDVDVIVNAQHPKKRRTALKSLESNDKSDTTDVDSDEPQFNHNHSVEEVLLGSPAHGAKMYSWEELELNLDGMVSTESVLEGWSKAGIADGLPLLRSLGFANYQVNLQDLVDTLDSELSRLEIHDSTVADRITFLTCIQALSRMELGYVKEKLEQANNELGKLRADIVEANERASFFDDKYTRMESARMNEVKEKLEQANNELSKLRADIVEANERASFLDDQCSRSNSAHAHEVKRKEQRHKKSVRLMTVTLLHERKMTAQNIRGLEGRVRRLKVLDKERHTTLLVMTEELRLVQTETVSGAEQLAKAKAQCEVLEREMAALVVLHRSSQELRAKKEQEQVRVLKEKLQGAQNENASVRDSNGELTVMVESLNSEIATLTSKAVLEKQGQYDKVRVLKEKLQGAQNENASLRDSNGELTVMVESLNSEIATLTPKAVPEKQGQYDKEAGPHAQPAASSEDNSSDDEPLSVLQHKIRHGTVMPDTTGMNGMQICTLTRSASIVNLMMVPPYDTLPSGSRSGGCAGMQSLSDSDQSPAETVESSMRAENKKLKKRVRKLTKKVHKRNEIIVKNIQFNQKHLKYMHE